MKRSKYRAVTVVAGKLYRIVRYSTWIKGDAIVWSGTSRTAQRKALAELRESERWYLRKAKA